MGGWTMHFNRCDDERYALFNQIRQSFVDAYKGAYQTARRRAEGRSSCEVMQTDIVQSCNHLNEILRVERFDTLKQLLVTRSAVCSVAPGRRLAPEASAHFHEEDIDESLSHPSQVYEQCVSLQKEASLEEE